MDPKQMRKTLDDLLAELERNPRIARRPTFMARYGRPLGFGLAIGVGGVAGCGSTGTTKDALPAAADAYGADMPLIVDSVPSPDTRDALPLAPDLYGIYWSLDGPGGADEAGLPDVSDVSPPDTRDVLPLLVDAYGLTVDSLPPAVDAYGADRSPIDARDVSPELDGGIDGGSVDGGAVDSDEAD
jgi:hypothetical protein